ncbi:MAG: GDSL-type esterase/lipase family protein [Planctomycetota bacterium]
MTRTRRRDFLTGVAATAGLTIARRADADDASAGHVVLLGDSVFDNGVYVTPGPPVVDQLRAKLPPGWKATLLAVDGSVTTDVLDQCRAIPDDATHLVVSSGGNDALANVGLLQRPADSYAEVLLAFADLRERFAATYERLARRLEEIGRPTMIATIYDPNFTSRVQQRTATVGLTVYNDVITRAASEYDFPLLDLRVLFDERADYANPIEPSTVGGAKIVDAILRFVGLAPA